MKITADIVGRSAGPIAQDIDARWLMAYAAGLGDTAAEYLDTARPGGIHGHPLFPVCYEWPLACELRAKTMAPDVLVRGVHATHDLRLHRRVRAGDCLSTTATVVSAEGRRSGTYVSTRFETVDARGRPVSTTDYGSVYRDVECEGATSASRMRGEHSDGRPAAEWSEPVAIPSTLAHVYTECARIWNPIHTDRAVARAAGLPDIILHGTATLALAVSCVLRRLPAGATSPVSRVACRFGAMVPLPSMIEVVAWRCASTGAEHTIGFEALDQEGRAVLRDGRVEIATSTNPVESSR